jgi:hypothetical protein
MDVFTQHFPTYVVGNPVKALMDETTELHTTCFRGSVEDVKRELDKPGAVDMLEVKGGYWESTPLMTAVSRLDVPLVKLLMQYGADINAVDLYGWNAFYVAVGDVWLFIDETPRRFKMLQLLIDAGVDTTLSIGENHGEFRDYGGTIGITCVLHAEVKCVELGFHTWQEMGNAWNPFVMRLLEQKADDRAKCLAFAMGHRERLGVDSRVLQLDKDVISMIGKMALGEFDEHPE